MEKISANTCGLSTLCRLCLRSNVTLLNIFHYSTTFESEVADVIMTCVPIQITKRDNVPNFICKLCYTQLKKVHRFQKQILHSDRALRLYLQQVNFPDKQIKLEVSAQSSSEEKSSMNLDSANEDYNAEASLKSEIKNESTDDETSLFPTDCVDAVENSYINDDCESNNENCSDTKVELINMNINKEETVSANEIDEDMSLKSEILNDPIVINSFITTQSMSGAVITTFNTDNSEVSREDTKANAGHTSGSLANPRSEKNKCISTSQVKYKKLIVKKHRCDVCEKCFCKPSQLNVHNKIHRNEKPYQCKVCGKYFNRLSNLQVHTRIHTGEKPYQCKVCEKCFCTSSQLNVHIKVHRGEKPYRCAVCEKCFYSSSDLMIHNRVHTGEKPYRCEICGKCFNVSANLKIHKRIHTGEKPYQCKVCEKGFCTSSHLKAHIKSHSSEKLYRCDVCDECFLTPSKLKNHNYIHTVGKLYQCDVCKMCFSGSSSLKRHTRLHNGKKPY